jgi:hypothetical protein
MTPRRAFSFTKVRKSISRHRWPINHVNHQPTYTPFINESPLTIPVVLPTSKLQVVTKIDSVQDLENIVKHYKGFVMAHTKHDPASIKKPFLPSEYKHLTQSHIVEIVSPFFTAKKEERHHYHIHDEAFEQKSRAAIITYQNSMPEKQFTELDRCIIGKDGKVAHEWEAVWECDDGTVWFLECKHQMTYVPPLSFMLIIAECLEETT